MNAVIFITNVALALILYFGNGFLGKLKSNSNGLFNYASFGFDKVSQANFADHFFQKIVHPAILIAIAASILQHFQFENIARELWLAVPLFWFFRIIHIVIWDISVFTNWKYEFTSMLISLLLGEGTLYIIIRPLIDAGENIFIDQTEFRDAFWFAAISYLAKLTWDISKASLSGYSVFPSEKRAKTILKRYHHFKWIYGAQIDIVLRDNYKFDNEHLRDHFLCLFYSIMIYEDHCRPKVIRFVEYIVKLFRWNKVMSLGIMQVQSLKIISSRTSIDLAINKIYNAFTSSTGHKRFYNTIIDYNPSYRYYTEVITIQYELSRMLGLPELEYQEE